MEAKECFADEDKAERLHLSLLMDSFHLVSKDQP